MELGLEEGQRLYERDLMLQQGLAWSPDLPASSASWPLRDTCAVLGPAISLTPVPGQLRKPITGRFQGPSPATGQACLPERGVRDREGWELRR